jgi:hypothetical protein
MTPIGLVELIEQVKKELLTPQANDERLFAVGNVEIELAFTATRAATGGLNLQVVSIGGDAGSERVQRIKITLEPLVTVEERREEYCQQHPEHHAKVSKALTREEIEA